MTMTVDHDCHPQSHHFNGLDALYQQPVKQAEPEVDFLALAVTLFKAGKALNHRIETAIKRVERSELGEKFRQFQRFTQELKSCGF